MESANLDDNATVGRDKIVIGDIAGSIAAIGAGAQVIVNQVERALTDPEVARQVEQLDRERLSKAVATYVGRLRDKAEEAASRPALGNPYKGLIQYDIDDAALFYGREAAIQAVFDRLERGPLTVLHAESGAGKTSLIKAGIVPHLLAAGRAPLYVRPYKTPVARAIKQGLMAQADLTPNLIQASLYDFVRWVTLMLLGQELVIILDQFEEVFLEQSPEDRTDLASQIALCLDDSLLPARWIISLRADQVSRLSTFREIKQPLANEYLLEPFTPDNAREIITVPARQRGVVYEAGLADRIIGELDQAGISPSQLQLVCSTLFDSLDSQQQITHAMYNAANGAKGILGSYLDIVLKRRVVPEHRQAAQRLLEALISSNRRRVPRARDELVRELGIQGISEATVTTLLNQLVESRLLNVEQQVALTYELVHDYLVDRIELDQATLDRKRAQELLDRATQDYEQNKRLLISLDRIEFIEKHGESLALGTDQLDLLFRSALNAGRSCQTWRDYAIHHQRTGVLADRWTAELVEGPGPTIQLLAILADAEAVSQLTRLIESHAPSDQDNPLRRSTPVQLRALIALAKMDCREAETHLAELTPDGYSFVPGGQPGDITVDERQAQLPSFWIARAPVRVQDWQAFMDSGAYARLDYWMDAERRTTAPAGWQHQLENLEQPVCHLTWYDAMAYAAWKAETTSLPVELPTETEWDKAGEAQDMTSSVLEWTRTEYRASAYRPEDGDDEVTSDHPRVLSSRAKDAPATRRFSLDPAAALDNTGCRMCLRVVPLTSQKAVLPASEQALD